MALTSEEILKSRTRSLTPDEIIQSRSEPKQDISVGESIVRGIGQGGTVGFGDEINAGVVALRKALTRQLVSKHYGNLPDELKASFSEDYKRERNKERARNTESFEQNPYAHGGAELATGLVQGFGGFGAIKEAGKQTLRQIAPRLAAIGAAEGGIYGLGTSEGETAGEVAADTAKGTIAGAIGAVAIPAAGQTMGRTYQKLVKNRGQRAADLVVDDLGKAGFTPEQAARYLEDNPELIVGDLGNNLQWHTGAVATSPGQGAEDVTNLLLQRTQNQLDDRIEPFFSQALGGDATQGIQKTLKDSQAQLSAMASPLYKEAYEQPIQLSDKIKTIINSPSGQKALEAAKDAASDDNVAFGPATSTRTLDYVARELNDMAERAKGQLGAATSKSDRLYKMRRELLEEVRAQNEPFRLAQAIYSDEKSIQEAYELGTKALTGNAMDKVDMIKNLSQAEQVAMRSGLFQAVMQKVGARSMDGDLSKAFKNENIRKVLRAAFDDPADFKAFEELIEKESMMARTSRPLNNSVTAPLSSFGQGLSEIATELITSGGDPAQAVGRFVAKKGMDIRGEQFRNELAPLLTAGGKDDLLKLLVDKSSREPYQVTKTIEKLTGG